jgi:type II secretory ATPase GspE/PulE/Tfp pilus assembly ATPase PilB-like protein
MILIAGPTGSGKSTTLFGMLKSFNPLDFNITTLEDPVEYNMPFVNQTQIKKDI